MSAQPLAAPSRAAPPLLLHHRAPPDARLTPHRLWCCLRRCDLNHNRLISHKEFEEFVAHAHRKHGGGTPPPGAKAAGPTSAEPTSAKTSAKTSAAAAAARASPSREAEATGGAAQGRATAFGPAAGKAVGLEVWRIEKLQPVALPVEQHGTLHAADRTL